MLVACEPPMFAAPAGPAYAEPVERRHALRDSATVHLLAPLDGRDVGLLTLELTSPRPPAGALAGGSTRIHR